MNTNWPRGFGNGQRTVVSQPGRISGKPIERERILGITKDEAGTYFTEIDEGEVVPRPAKAIKTPNFIQTVEIDAIAAQLMDTMIEARRSNGVLTDRDISEARQFLALPTLKKLFTMLHWSLGEMYNPRIVQIARELSAFP